MGIAERMNRTDLTIEVSIMMETMAKQLQLQDLQCKLLREKYLSLVEHGFTEEQAFELIKDK